MEFPRPSHDEKKRKAKAASAVARGKAKAGHAAVISLKPKVRAKLAAAKKIAGSSRHGLSQAEFVRWASVGNRASRRNLPDGEAFAPGYVASYLLA